MHGLFLEKIKLLMLTKITNAFPKIWVDKGSEFYNRSMKSFLQNEQG